MAIKTVVTRGYGNGTFNGTIALVVTRGYSIGAAIPPLIYTGTLDAFSTRGGTLDAPSTRGGTLNALSTIGGTLDTSQ